MTNKNNEGQDCGSMNEESRKTDKGEGQDKNCSTQKPQSSNKSTMTEEERRKAAKEGGQHSHGQGCNH